MRVYPNQGIPISRRGGTAGIGAAETVVAQSAMAAAVASAELPCTVKLRIWPHDIKRPSALLDPEMCRLVIPHAVLCRYDPGGELPLIVDLVMLNKSMTSSVEVNSSVVARSQLRLWVRVDSEMGAHFSPCGRFLAACVACVLPAFDAEYSILPATVLGSPNFGTRAHSPTQHPISTQQVIYELRVYSLEEAT
jgi:activator-of-BECN1-regulated-autophagy protein 1